MLEAFNWVFNFEVDHFLLATRSYVAKGKGKGLKMSTQCCTSSKY